MHHLQQSLLTAHGIQLHLHLHWQHGENRLNKVVPRATHIYFVDQLLSCGLTSLKTDMLSRYVKFVSSLQRSASAEVTVVANIVLRMPGATLEQMSGSWSQRLVWI